MDRSTAGATRRRLLKSVAVASGAGLVAATLPHARRLLAAEPNSTTFVLVHGAWHGGWCWGKVSPLLRAAGHAVYTPTLTGLGERAHLLAPTVDLQTHVQDIVGVLDYDDLSSVVLVGHSYGGMVISGVVDRLPERVAQVVFLDAFVPERDQSALELLAPQRSAQFREQAKLEGDGWLVPAPAPELYGVVEPADLEWVRPRLGPQPLATLDQPLELRGTGASDFARAYIACTEYPAFRPFAERARLDQAWRYREIASGHDAMIVKPRELADILLDLGAPAGARALASASWMGATGVLDALDVYYSHERCAGYGRGLVQGYSA
jgi:pimeloyl-ACP methyl ester carboxylesterase